MIHQAGLDLTSTRGVQAQETTGLNIPWRYPHKANNSSPKYHTLDTLSNQCDNLSYMDAMTTRSCDSHVTKNVYSPWWKCEPDTDLSDQLSLSDCNASISQTTCKIRTTLEALMRLGGLLPAADGGGGLLPAGGQGGLLPAADGGGGLLPAGGQGGLLPAADGGGDLYGLAWQEKESRFENPVFCTESRNAYRVMADMHYTGNL